MEKKLSDSYISSESDNSKKESNTPKKVIDTFYMDNERFVTREIISQKRKIGKGEFGIAYEDAGRVYKLLNAPGSNEQYVNMTTIKNLNLPNFYKLYDILFTKDGEKRVFAGTISKFYQREDVDMFLAPKDYLIDNFNALLESVRTLAKHGIGVGDLHVGNSIVNKDGIFIIDTDLYGKKECLTNHRLITQNEFRYISFLLDLLYGNFSDHHGPDCSLEQIVNVNSMIHTLVTNCVMNNQSISEKLADVKYPMDYVTKIRR